MSRLIYLCLAAFVAAAPASAVAQTEKPSRSCWSARQLMRSPTGRPFYDILTKDGYEVLVVQNPTHTIEDDVATTARVIAAAKHPVVLVGHSYGGAVITEAGDNPKVRTVVYLAAFAPDIGESVAELAEKPTRANPTRRCCRRRTAI